MLNPLNIEALRFQQQLFYNFKDQKENDDRHIKDMLSKKEIDEVDAEEETENNKVDYLDKIEKATKINFLIEMGDSASLKQMLRLYEMLKELIPVYSKRDAAIAAFIALCAETNLNVSNLPVQEAFLLSNAMLYIPLDLYEEYNRILKTIIDKSFLSEILKKEEDLDNQMPIIEGLFDYYDAFCPTLDDAQYENAIAEWAANEMTNTPTR